MNNFNLAVNLILDHEGGYSLDRFDPGGETNYGISKRAYPNENIRELTKERAKTIYKLDYWDKIRGDELPFPVAVVAFDIAVNMGVSVAVKMLQGSVDERQDGIIGDKTMRGVQCHSNALIVEKMTTARILRYASLSTFQHYKSGWVRRSVETLVFSLSMKEK